jgi:hypothetical protein
MQFSRVLFLVALAACASSQSTGGAPTPTTERTEIDRSAVGNVATMDWRPDLYTWTHAIPAAPERTWTVLPAVYAQLGITGEILESDKRVFGARRARFRRQLAGQLPSRFLDCGSQLGMKNADNNTLLLNIMTAVVPSPDGGSVLQTQINGIATPEAQTSNSVQCTSNGKLETQIAALVGARIRELP